VPHNVKVGLLSALVFLSLGSAVAQESKLVPKTIVGQLRPLALVALDALGIRYELRYRRACDLGDVVLSSNPPPGSALDANNPVVFLEINAGDGTTTVPDAIGKTLAQVSQLFAESCVRVEDRIVIPKERDFCSRWVPMGDAWQWIVATVPQPGTVVPVNSVVVAQREAIGRWESMRYPNGQCP
jgi:hypothetical protein